MDLLVGSLALRPYVFLFLAVFLIAGARDLGLRRALLFGALVWPLAWAAEFSSIHVGFPFGLYHYTGLTRGQELYVAGVPFFDSLSFTFLAYAGYCLARRGASPRILVGGGLDGPLRDLPQDSIARAKPALGGDGTQNSEKSWASRGVTAVLAGFFMMMLDVVIDPLAVRGERWFLGHVFYYPNGGVYFGVPPSNFAGWWLVGAIGVLAYEACVRPGRSRGAGRVGAGIALYYAVLVFNLAVTGWIGEWTLVAVGFALHALMALAVVAVVRQAPTRSILRTEGVERG